MSAPIQDVLQLYPAILLLGQREGRRKDTQKTPKRNRRMLRGPSTTQEAAEPPACAPNLPKTQKTQIPAPGAAEQRGKAPK